MDIRKQKLLVVEGMNEEVGNLKYINCPKCKNKGYIYKLSETNNINAIPCECRNERDLYRGLELCGISKEMFDCFTFQNYKTDTPFKKRVYEVANNYVESILGGNSNWFYYGADSGLGKTHICTAIIKKLLSAGRKCKSFFWKEQIPKLRYLRKSFDSEAQETYSKTLLDLVSVDILYIDDFFKNWEEKEKEEKDIAFEILNTRYNNNLPTMISSELNGQALSKVDMAIYGRIFQRSKGIILQPKTCDEDGKSRNYRLYGDD